MKGNSRIKKKKWRLKRNRIKTYLRQMQKGHAPNIRERDIQYAFKMKKRLEMFDMDMSEVDAHTLKLVEMIEAEKTQIEMNKANELERQVK